MLFVSRRTDWKVVLTIFSLGVTGCGRTTLGLDTGAGEASSTGGADGSGASPGVGGSGVGGGDVMGSGGAGGFPEKFCQVDSDCFTADRCLVSLCSGEGLCVYEPRDQDGDGHGDDACGGTDCNDLNARAFPGGLETCSDGSDNDCNGVSDCFDPVCKSVPVCGCTPAASGENCQNTFDDDCDGAVDCLDTDCQGTTACGCDTEQCENGGDDDCDGQIDCADSDCAGHPSCLCQASPEVCGNGADEDCDGLVDCADPSCHFNAACLCLVPKDEVCGDGRDNDCDGLVDCGDLVCLSHPSCAGCVTEFCTGGKDDDCDGLIDCSDPSCAFDPACPPSPELCNNDRDDDLDGLGDCNDPDCVNTQICQQRQNTCATARRIEPLSSASYSGDTTGQLSNFQGSCGGDAGEAVFRLELSVPITLHVDTVGTSFDSVMYVKRGSCAFGEEIACDDDGGGFQWSSALDFPLLEPGTYFIYVDGLAVDPDVGVDEGRFVLNVEAGPAVEVCNDDFDNDGDRYSDCADTECRLTAGCLGCNQGGPAVAEFGTFRCTDGVDNDCDGLADCVDPDCSANDQFPQECCTGFDQNGNGIPDDFNCRCATDADCSDGQICYTSTVSACGIPCESYVGDNCTSMVPGSECNLVTQQCEF